MTGADWLVIVVVIGVLAVMLALDVVVKRAAHRRDVERNAEARRLRREARRQP
jgi:hypothetical protein